MQQAVEPRTYGDDNLILPPELQAFIRDRRWTKLAASSIDWPNEELIAPELVDVLRELDSADRALFFRALPKRVAAEVFAYLEGDTRDNLLRELTDSEARRLLADLNPDDRTNLL